MSTDASPTRSGSSDGSDRRAQSVADFGTRFSAFTIDAALLFAGQWIVFIVLSRQLQAVGLTTTEPCSAETTQLCEGPSNALWALLVVLLLVSTVGYYAWFDGRYGATPGKRWMGIEVRGVDGGVRVGLGRGMVRAVVRQAFWLSLFVVIEASPLSLDLPAVLFIGIPMACIAAMALGAVTPSGRSVHDLAAGTTVVRPGSDRSTPPVLPIVPAPDSLIEDV